MANKTLDIKLNLNATDPINGVLTLNDVRNQGVIYDDGTVRTASVTVASGSSSQLIAAVGSSTKVVYTYIKNTDTTNFLVLKNDAGQVWGRLLPGQFSMISVAEVAGLEVQADTANVIIDYAVFTSP
tara:strand:+ start:23709 stop:24089 length:381 start_codon:yes stop_codon:yes gene_type:complete